MKNLIKNYKNKTYNTHCEETCSFINKQTNKQKYIALTKKEKQDYLTYEYLASDSFQVGLHCINLIDKFYVLLKRRKF